MNNPNRINSLALSLTLSFVLLLLRVLQLQFQHQPSLDLNTNQARLLTSLEPKRGIIYSLDNVPLALNQINLVISLYKPELKLSQQQLIDRLSDYSPLIPSDITSITTFFQRPELDWIDLNTRYLPQLKPDLAKISGVKINTISDRVYPQKFSYPHLVGSYGKNMYGNHTGTSGLENYYNRHLQGQTGYFYSLKDALGNPIISKNTLFLPPTDGQPVYTGLNRFVQKIVETELTSGINQFQAKSGTAIVLEPQTCQIIAMASFEASNSALIAPNPNPSLARLLEPGSVFKPLIVASALDSRQVSPDYVCPTCDRPFKASGFEINNWDNSFHPNTNLKDILKNSDNIGMSHLINRLGLTKFLDYFNQMGLDRLTQVDLPGETASQPKSYWSDIDLATASFGQGIALTPLQMATAFNILANSGVRCTPHVNRQLPTSSTPVFNPQTTATVAELLKYATENSAANTYRPNNLEACAKSGTAQVAVGGSYNSNQIIASYIGFSPCFQPKFTLYVILDNPEVSNWGSATAAPIWYKIAHQIDSLL